jgi:hypothetical protein
MTDENSIGNVIEYLDYNNIKTIIKNKDIIKAIDTGIFLLK